MCGISNILAGFEFIWLVFKKVEKIHNQLTETTEFPVQKFPVTSFQPVTVEIPKLNNSLLSLGNAYSTNQRALH